MSTNVSMSFMRIEPIITTMEMKLQRDTIFFGTNSPHAASELITENNIQVVLLDIQMPKVNGLSVLKKIKHDAPDVAVIMYTMRSETNSVVEYIKEGFWDKI